MLYFAAKTNRKQTKLQQQKINPITLIGFDWDQAEQYRKS
jgi:hypothetical protein